jgi:hypothetical protein
MPRHRDAFNPAASRAMFGCLSAAKSAPCEIRGEKQAVNSLGMREDRAENVPQITQGRDPHLAAQRRNPLAYSDRGTYTEPPPPSCTFMCLLSSLSAYDTIMRC